VARIKGKNENRLNTIIPFVPDKYHTFAG